MKPSGMPLVSVVIPTHNRQELLLEAVDSVLAQTWDELELIVVDDGSNDDSARILRERIRDPRLQVATQANRGALALSLGPSRDLASAVLLAWISPLAGVLILALAVLTIWAWLSRRWHRGFRILTTMTVLCSLVMVMLGVRWDLFTMLV